MAFQTNAFQNLDAHGTKGFQTTAGGAASGLMWVWHHHHSHGAWLIPLLVRLVAA